MSNLIRAIRRYLYWWTKDTKSSVLLARALVHAFKTRPQDFSLTEYKLVDNATGMRWWIANGVWFFSLCNPDEFESPDFVQFGVIQKFYIWCHFLLLIKREKPKKEMDSAAEDAFHKLNYTNYERERETMAQSGEE